MTRMIVPWTRLPRPSMDWELDLPRWMSKIFEEEPFDNGTKFLPEANVVETDKAVEVTVDLPGMKPDDVKVEFHDGRLFVTGEKKEEKEEKGKTYHRVERRSGSFRRVIAMPSMVDDAHVDATFTEGVLKVTLPKSREVAHKAIPIKTNVKG